MTEFNKPTNPPAFPRPASEAHQYGVHSHQVGMTLRDYFAAQAMQGMLAAKGWHPDFMFPTDFNFDAGQRAADAVAAVSYQYADAMLKAREA
jgi:hypothetical protein